MSKPLATLHLIYKRVLSPALHLLSATFIGCKFHPTCSSYAKDAIQVHGILKGLRLALWRVLKCGPFTNGGYDPVPPKCGEKCKMKQNKTEHKDKE